MNRRSFIRTLLSGSMLPLGSLSGGVWALGNSAHTRRLVLVELAGANDGLNTLVPYANDFYHQLRPTIGLNQHQVLPIGGEFGMHTAMSPLLKHWEQGDMAWVQGLGYPRPNRSHFQSIALWETAGDGYNRRGRYGWMTHAIEHRLARHIRDPHGISMSGDMSLFASDSGRWLSMKSAEQLLNKSVPGLQGTKSDHPTLSLLQDRLQTLDSTMSRMSDKLSNAPELPVFEGGAFGQQLRDVATLIAAGLDTPVYRVSMGGFDTHENQAARHPRLLETLSGGLDSFVQQLKSMSEWNNTIVMSYSEFGRRAAENSSGGTDHGTAAPHWVLGGAINGGLYGQAPDLAQLTDGDPAFTMDYRALYQRALVDGLGAQDRWGTLASHTDSMLEGLVKSA